VYINNIGNMALTHSHPKLSLYYRVQFKP